MRLDLEQILGRSSLQEAPAFIWSLYGFLREKKSTLIPLKNEINEMISFLISPKTLSVSMEILVRDFQCLDVDMIDSAWKVLVLARKGNVDLNG